MGVFFSIFYPAFLELYITYVDPTCKKIIHVLNSSIFHLHYAVPFITPFIIAYLFQKELIYNM